MYSSGFVKDLFFQKQPKKITFHALICMYIVHTVLCVTLRNTPRLLSSYKTSYFCFFAAHWLDYIHVFSFLTLLANFWLPSTHILTEKFASTLESGINVHPWINVSPLENLAKRIIVAPFFTLYYEVRNKAVAPGKKSKN